jgi:hypothetical protein
VQNYKPERPGKKIGRIGIVCRRETLSPVSFTRGGKKSLRTKRYKCIEGEKRDGGKSAAPGCEKERNKKVSANMSIFHHIKGTLWLSFLFASWADFDCLGQIAWSVYFITFML